jgi:hypothetical protein
LAAGGWGEELTGVDSGRTGVFEAESGAFLLRGLAFGWGAESSCCRKGGRRLEEERNFTGGLLMFDKRHKFRSSRSSRPGQQVSQHRMYVGLLSILTSKDAEDRRSNTVHFLLILCHDIKVCKNYSRSFSQKSGSIDASKLSSDVPG